ncbi:hypothetical protein P4056_08810 [Pseudomonas aeruginosa]|nr:hypothetical protein [Pseudomonas aeruginosa]
MKLALSVLLLATMLSGCSTVGNVFKKTGQILMDPSIQVGSADDQPTQIALSLYANLDVNPNSESLPLQIPVAEEGSMLSDGDTDGPLRSASTAPVAVGWSRACVHCSVTWKKTAMLPTKFREYQP